jgi:hypothetical protein
LVWGSVRRNGGKCKRRRIAKSSTQRALRFAEETEIGKQDAAVRAPDVTLDLLVAGAGLPLSGFLVVWVGAPAAAGLPHSKGAGRDREARRGGDCRLGLCGHGAQPFKAQGKPCCAPAKNRARDKTRRAKSGGPSQFSTSKRPHSKEGWRCGTGECCGRWRWG